MWDSLGNLFIRTQDNDEEALQLAALQRTPTFVRARTSVFRNSGGEFTLVDISKLDEREKKVVLEKLISYLDRIPGRIETYLTFPFSSVDLKFPKVEVRFENLGIDAFVHVGSRALPTLPNSVYNMSEAFLRKLRIFPGRRKKLSILNNISGIIKPSRLTLLLGPPSSGKTTLLLALAGRLGHGLKLSGRITYNGHELDEFVPQRTSAYVNQKDCHMAEMTVRETLKFAEYCQGFGYKKDMILELLRREKNAGIRPDEDLDIFIKVEVLMTVALGENKTSLVVDYLVKVRFFMFALYCDTKIKSGLSKTLCLRFLYDSDMFTKILGLDICVDTLVGDEMRKGISGGQMKRLTSGELLVGPQRVLFMDEISTGLDSSTTYQIIKYLKHTTRALDETTVISLLQPDSETFELFDDLILLCEGQIVFQGPRSAAVSFFASMGFRCPKRKNVADFLQEVTSVKDQEQYWSLDEHYEYVSVEKFVEAFQSNFLGSSISRELAVPFDRRRNHPAALAATTYGVKRMELLKISFSWQMLLLKRDSYVYIFKFIQLMLVVVVMTSVFFRTTMHHDSLEDGGVYLGALYFAIVMILFNGFMEVPMLVAKLPVIYKHRDLHFYPCWVYTLPSWILSIPSSIIESGIWVAVTYYLVGFDPQFSRCLKQFLLYFSLNQMSIALFRVMGSLGRNMIVANTFGSFAMLVVMALGGFILSRDSIPAWWIWGYWFSPLMYAQNAVSVNEFLGETWNKAAGSNTNIPLGTMLLKVRSLFPEDYWYWIGVCALLGYTILFNILFTLFLTYLNPLGSHQAVISREAIKLQKKRNGIVSVIIDLKEYLRTPSYAGRNMIVANTFGSFAMLVVMALGGFILSRDSIPAWWIWGYWFSPLMYAQNAVSVNEFLGETWNKAAGNNTNIPLGTMLLKVRSLFPEDYWYWIGVCALLGYTILFNILFTLFLTYLNPLGNHQAVISREATKLQKKRNGIVSVIIDLKEYLRSPSYAGNDVQTQRGMVLPFQPLTMSFRNISYYVDVPGELKQQGLQNNKLQLLVNVTGAFRPGVLTALVGVSGAGKTTLMDVLAGRKTDGQISGHIYVSGYPKIQETFARISGYCEQNDVHSPCLTVHESLMYSAWLRLPSDIDVTTKRDFVAEVMELVELTSLKGALVGLPGIDGLSTEQRKRLTIAVELVANPSIVFMDEPTSGLDARAAAIVMRTVRNIVNTGRTIVCTIHQPSIDIFESFDELLLMKRGGKLIYAGPLGTGSHKVIQFFEAVNGVPKIRPGYNPAAWILEATSSTEEHRLGIDFADVYRGSNLYLQNQELVENLSKPDIDSKFLFFPTRYSQSFLGQFFACLWKQNLSYWRNPQYTAVRFFYTVIISLMFGTMCWKFGAKRETQQDIFNAMGSMYAAVLFIGITNAASVQPVVYVERSVSYRERAAGMYSALPFAFAQVAIEFPYVYVQSLVYSVIFYFLASFEWSVLKLFWYIYFMYFTLLYFTFFGMMTIAVTPNHNIAAIVAAPFYMLWNLFSGFMIVRMRLPIWWRWYYWANPVAWSLYGLLTSQYGDVNEPIKLADGSHSVPLRQFLKDQFGSSVLSTLCGYICIYYEIIQFPKEMRKMCVMDLDFNKQDQIMQFCSDVIIIQPGQRSNNY
ncbi:pleiotropic drug resistance protein PDR/CDR [Artemisia annua]|uniref:Pleiotropic drug resistance protein PDR/CDR n=1 Tax=Artemisia annua TaxID=35608 RepID=A0A2U1QKC1_ARTAN|nr:pleiotropic drug resistance protein PDR/CDR [Artemisia annua]